MCTLVKRPKKNLCTLVDRPQKEVCTLVDRPKTKCPHWSTGLKKCAHLSDPPLKCACFAMSKLGAHCAPPCTDGPADVRWRLSPNQSWSKQGR